MDKFWQNFKTSTGLVTVGFALFFLWISFLSFLSEQTNAGVLAVVLCGGCVWFHFDLAQTLEKEEQKKKLDKWRQE